METEIASLQELSPWKALEFERDCLKSHSWIFYLAISETPALWSQESKKASPIQTSSSFIAVLNVYFSGSVYDTGIHEAHFLCGLTSEEKTCQLTRSPHPVFYFFSPPDPFTDNEPWLNV